MAHQTLEYALKELFLVDAMNANGLAATNQAGNHPARSQTQEQVDECIATCQQWWRSIGRMQVVWRPWLVQEEITPRR